MGPHKDGSCCEKWRRKGKPCEECTKPPSEADLATAKRERKRRKLTRKADELRQELERLEARLADLGPAPEPPPEA